MIDVKFKLQEGATLPVYATKGAIGMDLTATQWSRISDDIIEYRTGVFMELPEGYGAHIMPRSSIHKTDLMLANSVGLIDSDYRGELIVKFRITSGSKIDKTEAKTQLALDISLKRYEIGDRIAQLVIFPRQDIRHIVVDELSSTERGEGGFGSTGK